jgi:hypothetical protein
MKLKNLIFVGILNGTEEKSRVRIRICKQVVHGSASSDPDPHQSLTGSEHYLPLTPLTSVADP